MHFDPLFHSSAIQKKCVDHSEFQTPQNQQHFKYDADQNVERN